MNAFEKIKKGAKDLARASIYGTLISASMLSPIDSYASIGKDIQNAIQKITLTENRKEDMQKEVDRISKKYSHDYFIKQSLPPFARTCFVCNLANEQATKETNHDLLKLQDYQEKLGMSDSAINETKRLLVYSFFCTGVNERFREVNRKYSGLAKYISVKKMNKWFDRAIDLAYEVAERDSAFAKSDDLIGLFSKTLSEVELCQGDPSFSSGKKFMNKEVPEISATYWVNSKPLKLKDLRGKVVMLDFWSTMCGPCVDALPDVEKMWEKYKDRGFVAISIHNSVEDTAMVREFVEKKGLTYPIAVDSATGEAYGIQSIPQFWLLDKQGRFRPGTSIETLLEEPYTK
jgi:thiol-disulfide isomerase/thioredoxin